MIRETLVVTRRPDGGAHLAPMGAQSVILPDGAEGVLLQPFRPSATLENLQRWPYATLNHVDDVRLFAGCLTGRRDWPVREAGRIACARLDCALAHEELAVERVEDDPGRPRFFLRLLARASHAPFPGFNRAKAAVIEAAILVSRLHLLPPEKVARSLRPSCLLARVVKSSGPSRVASLTPNRPSLRPLYETYWVPGRARLVLPRSSACTRSSSSPR